MFGDSNIKVSWANNFSASSEWWSARIISGLHKLECAKYKKLERLRCTNLPNVGPTCLPWKSAFYQGLNSELLTQDGGKYATISATRQAKINALNDSEKNLIFILLLLTAFNLVNSFLPTKILTLYVIRKSIFSIKQKLTLYLQIPHLTFLRWCISSLINQSCCLIFPMVTNYGIWNGWHLLCHTVISVLCIVAQFGLAWYKAKQRWKSGVIILCYSFWIMWRFDSRETKLNYTLPEYLRCIWGSTKNVLAQSKIDF